MLAAWEQEHEAQVREADVLMSAIDGLDPERPDWLEQVNSLGSTLAGHIRHEEDDIWPRIRAGWPGETLEHAGRQMDSAKTAAEAGTPIDEAIDSAGSAMA